MRLWCPNCGNIPIPLGVFELPGMKEFYHKHVTCKRCHAKLVLKDGLITAEKWWTETEAEAVSKFVLEVTLFNRQMTNRRMRRMK